MYISGTLEPESRTGSGSHDMGSHLGLLNKANTHFKCTLFVLIHVVIICILFFFFLICDILWRLNLTGGKGIAVGIITRAFIIAMEMPCILSQ